MESIDERIKKLEADVFRLSTERAAHFERAEQYKGDLNVADRVIGALRSQVDSLQADVAALNDGWEATKAELEIERRPVADQGTHRRLLVTGSRRGHRNVCAVLDAWVAEHGMPDLLLVGDAPGVDTQVWKWANDRGAMEVACMYMAEWDRYGRSAGPRRNAEMIARAGQGACVLAFPCTYSKGTWDCVKQASNAGLHVYVVPG